MWLIDLRISDLGACRNKVLLKAVETAFMASSEDNSKTKLKAIAGFQLRLFVGLGSEWPLPLFLSSKPL